MRRWVWLCALVIGAMRLGPSALAQAKAECPFADVPPHHWAYDAVAELAALGICDGYPNRTFRGERDATRYEFASLLARSRTNAMRMDDWCPGGTRYGAAALAEPCLLSAPLAPAPDPKQFPDVWEEHWSYDDLNALTPLGVLTGYPDGSYHGSHPLARYEVAEALHRLLHDLHRYDPFSAWPSPLRPRRLLNGVPAAHWAAEAAAELREWEVLEGYPDSTFRGERAMTRYELAVALQKLNHFLVRIHRPMTPIRPKWGNP